jgi:hypothetical protein
MFYAGVFSLVALSITVMIGLAATDRVVLLVRHRVLLQAVHRAMALAAMVFLGVHIAINVLDKNVQAIDTVVPFLSTYRTLYIGLGTVASWLMITVTWTGIVRGRFAGSAHPGIWRALHSAAYIAWPLALAHGLESGRHAKTWVTLSYAGCLLLVSLALLVRLCVTWGRRLSGPKAQTTGTIKAIGKPVFAPSAAVPAPIETPVPAPRRPLDDARLPSGGAAPRRARRLMDDGLPRRSTRGSAISDASAWRSQRPTDDDPRYDEPAKYSEPAGYDEADPYEVSLGYEDPAPLRRRPRTPVDDLIAPPPPTSAPPISPAPPTSPAPPISPAPQRPRTPVDDLVGAPPPRRRRRSLEELAAPTEPAPRAEQRQRGKAMEDISDEEFWAHMRGEALR